MNTETLDERIARLVRAYSRIPGIHAAVAVWALVKLQRARKALLSVASAQDASPSVHETALEGLGLAHPAQIRPDDFPPEDA